MLNPIMRLFSHVVVYNEIINHVVVCIYYPIVRPSCSVVYETINHIVVCGVCILPYNETINHVVVYCVCALGCRWC